MAFWNISPQTLNGPCFKDVRLYLPGSIAVTFAMLYWVILCFVVPCAVMENYAPSLAGYLLASRERKLVFSATPTLGTYWILKILMISQDLTGDLHQYF